jgi:hypothetical protein
MLTTASATFRLRYLLKEPQTLNEAGYLPGYFAVAVMHSSTYHLIRGGGSKALAFVNGVLKESCSCSSESSVLPK